MQKFGKIMLNYAKKFDISCSLILLECQYELLIGKSDGTEQGEEDPKIKK